ncbi:myocyte-specific enhancer factor 2D isoform X4 [Mirounga angustirostris]|uniref:myocyte-specific enhancer factor 2D isoform X4 n=1 Tax=Mirounga leonina TaxID=9715 RepID=UPI00156C2749|nr:myocyte-specific enhancer factor 2D isoform X4 [Mirounga leonina]XP_045732602.1 myocyte-specific enhancer factor 2D isoform X4 [Mirounga angustirostris]
MGRKKIQIQRITDERNRQVTFTKRKFGLMKKAYELSVLCDCEIALIIFNHSNKLFQYASTDMDKVLLKYTEYNEPHESRTNADIIEALHKKHRECESPEVDEVFALTPQTEEKYKKIDEEFDKMMQSYRLASAVPAPNFAMPVTVPVSSQSSLQFSNPSGSLVTPSLVTSSLTDPRLLSPQQPALQRNSVSPGLPQRPASAGAMLGGDLNSANGACPSPVGNGYVSARASPGLLPVANGNSLNKGIPAKSPPPPTHSAQHGAPSRKPDLRVITSQGGKGLMHHLNNAQRLGASQSTHSLTTPVVSVATPSLLSQGLPFSSMPTAYNTDYQLSSAELSSLPTFSSPGGLSLGSVTAWPQPAQPPQPPQPQPPQPPQPPPQQPQQPPQPQPHLVPVSLSSLIPGSPLPHVGAALTVTTHPHISIKSEPVSPSRERSPAPPPPAVFPAAARPEPGDGLSSPASSSYETGDRDDGRGDFGPTLGLLRPAQEPEAEGPAVKRMRLDTWTLK